MNIIPFVRRAVPSLAVLSCVALTSLGAVTPPQAPAGTETPLAVQRYEVDGVQVELLSVKRTSDGYLTVKWQYRNTTDKPVTIGANTGAMRSAWSAPYSLSWDFRVLANGKELKVPGQTMAAKHGNKINVVPAKKVLTTWAKVPDPGADVQKVNVSIQGADPFEDVAVT
jgi:hypothetical protein